MKSFKKYFAHPGSLYAIISFMRNLRSFLIVFLALVFTAGAASGATSVTQHGITWYFNSNHVTGRYVSGDYWVLGPVTITNITPHTVTSNAIVGGNTISVTRNGTMINPTAGFLASATNGWDTLYLGSGYAFNQNKYSSSLNVGNVSAAAPLIISTNASIVSTWSKPYNGNDIRPSQYAMAILTVVTSLPAADAFRPQPYRGSKVQTNRYANLDWTVLRNLPVVSNTPSFSSVERWFCGWMPEAYQGGGLDQYTRPVTNCPDNYPAYTSEDIGDALCLVNLNYTQAQKSNLVVWLTQYGLDIYGAALDGAVWRDLGGLSIGRKAPMVFAGSLLNQSNILAHAKGSNYFIFQEDRQIWFVTQSDVGRALRHDDYPSKYRVEYIQADVGMAEWGDQHTQMPSQDGRNLDAAYRDICLRALNRVVPAIRLMGLEDEWGWPATFAYHDRMWALYQSGELPAADWEGSTLNWYSPFAISIWRNYGNSGSTPPPPDTSPPLLNSISVAGVSSNGATVVWTSNEPSDSQVQFGISSSLGLASPLNAALGTSHSVNLTDLVPATLYFFQVRSRDAVGNLAMSTNYSFTTSTVTSATPNSLAVISVVASSDDGNIAANTRDGDLATRWSASGDGQWIEYDFGIERQFAYALIAFANGASRTATFDIDVSNDRLSWSQVFHGSSSGTTLQLERYEMGGVSGRYVRIVGHGNSDNMWNSITEIVFGGPASIRPPAPQDLRLQ